MGGSVTKIIRKAVNAPVRAIKVVTGGGGGSPPARSADTREEIAAKTDIAKKTEADKKDVTRRVTRRSRRVTSRSLIAGSGNIAASGADYSPIRNPRDRNSTLG
jgi:hemin uptake protein HemP